MALVCGFDEAKVHELYPEASMVKAMEIWQLPKGKKNRLEEFADNGEYMASVKKDGYFYMLNKTPNHTYLFSRKPSVKTGLLSEKIGNVPHLAEVAQTLPADTLLVGEIYIPGKTSKAVTSIMNCLPANAVSRQKASDWVHYYINDVVMYDGVDFRDTPFEERYMALQTIFGTHFADNEYVELAENVSENIYETAMAHLDNGEEGMVLKRKDSKYECGKRTAWMSIKIKQEDTLDVVITAFCDPTKEYKGKELDSWPYWVVEELVELGPGSAEWMEHERSDAGNPGAIRSPKFRTLAVTKPYFNGWKNAVEISAYNDEGNLVKIGTVSSGLTDELRADFAEHPKKYLNRVIEVKCMSLDTVEKTVRHGFFLKFRDDKNPEDCKISEIFA